MQSKIEAPASIILNLKMAKLELHLTKKMFLFYSNNIKDDIAELPQEEAMHCVKTLRKKVGDTIHFVDGKGGLYSGKIIGTGKKTCTIGIETVDYQAKRKPKIHIAIAPTKNINRFEWFLEKTTEFGVDEITPLLCFHSERKNIRLDRLEKVIQSAMKQSLKAHLPKLNDLTSFKDFINSEKTTESQKIIAHCQTGREGHLKDVYNVGQNATILIGPEGDFATAEIEIALQEKFQPISLGEARLRTETAGIAACHIFNLRN